MNTAEPLTAESQTADRTTALGDVAATADQDHVRVATYNVRYAGIDDGSLSWANRRDGVASAVRTIAPDAVAIQECWMEQLDDLRDRLPGYEWVASPDRNGEHTPVGYRTDRFAVEAEGAFGVAPGGEREVLAWDAALPRTVTHATLRDTVTDHAFSVFSVHLDHRGSRARAEGARIVLDRLPDGPAVVAGDLNCEPGSKPYRILAADLDDAAEATATRTGPAETFAGFGGDAVDEPAAPEPRRIDYVFVRGFDVAAYRVATPEATLSPPPSDHRPVVADLVPVPD